MKVQEVILKAMAGRLKWWEAAEILGVTDRTMRRWRERYQQEGYGGLYDYRKRQPSPKRIPVETLQRVLRLYRERYFDFNVRHFHEKLREEHGIKLSSANFSTGRGGFLQLLGTTLSPCCRYQPRRSVSPHQSLQRSMLLAPEK